MKKRRPIARAGMDLDAGQPAPEVGNEARQPLEARMPQSLCDRRCTSIAWKPGIAGDRLPTFARGRVALEYDGDFFFETRRT